MPARSRASIAALTLLLFACRPSQQEFPISSRHDSTGALVVTLKSLNQPTAPRWRSSQVFSTARSDIAPLGRYVDARFLPDTSLVVAHTSELLVFTPSGTLARTIGRNGDGPGEYRVINRLGISENGTLLVGDMGSGRVTLLGPDGTVRGILPRLGSPSPSYEMDPLTLLPGGRIVARYWQARPNRDAVGIRRGAFERDSAPLLLFDFTAARAATTLGNWDGLERARVSLGGEPARLPPPFARTALFHARGDWMVAGPTDSLDLTVFHDTTRTLRLVAHAVRHLPTSTDAGAWSAAITRDYPDIAARYLDAIADGAQVPAFPALGCVRLDERGDLWVGAYEVPGTSERPWWIFSPEGAVLGTLTLPGYDEPMMASACEILDIFGDRIALLREDTSGAPFIEVRRLLR